MFANSHNKILRKRNLLASQDGCRRGEGCTRVVGLAAGRAECCPEASRADLGEVEPLWS